MRFPATLALLLVVGCVFATQLANGDMLAPDKALATLPISVFVVGMAGCIVPAGAIARRYGRRAAFLAGTFCGVLVGILAAIAVVIGSFWLFCLGTFFGGAYAAVVLSFRFAAADCVEPEQRPRALSTVMVGGVAAGIVGPQLVTATMHLWPPHMFAPTFVAQAIVAALSAIVLIGVRLPMPTTAEIAGGRPLADIAKQPRFIIAALCGAISYMLMNFLMTAAPLAMRMSGHSQENSNVGLQWHVIAMYAPSFVTGKLITHFGAVQVVITGLLLIGGSAVLGLAGVSIMHFWVMLVLLGIGWNFGFVGSSVMVLDCHAEEERTKAQALNDFIVFGTMAVGSVASGGLLNAFGWNTVLWVSIGPLVSSALALFRSSRRNGKGGAAAAMP
jgi:MFS family permease